MQIEGKTCPDADCFSCNALPPATAITNEGDQATRAMLPGNGANFHVANMAIALKKKDAVHDMEAAIMAFDHVSNNIFVVKIACIEVFGDYGVSKPAEVGFRNIRRHEFTKVNPATVMMLTLV